MYLVLISLLFSAVTQILFAARDGRVNASFTLSTVTEIYEVDFNDKRIDKSIVCGSYSYPFSGNSGYTLHIFPDGSLVFTNNLGVGGVKVLAIGSWSVGKSLLLRWENGGFPEETRKFLLPRLGRLEALTFCGGKLKGDRPVLFLCDPDRAADLGFYLLKVSEYLPWQEIRDSLIKNFENLREGH